MPVCKCAGILFWIAVVNITGSSGSWKTSTNLQYKRDVMLKVLYSLFPKKGAPMLPSRNYDARNPFNSSGTLFRFHINDGLLILRGTRAVKPMQVCKFQRSPTARAYCRLPLVGSFAVYNCTLSFGRNVTDRFRINSTVMEYEGWKNPADVSGYFDVTGFPDNQRLVLTSVYVTEFAISTTSSPPFENFTVFDKFDRNQTLITKLWDNFTEYVFRKCKQDMRNLTKKVYTKRMREAAAAVEKLDIIKLLN